MKTAIVTPIGYESKSDNYFEWSRKEMLPFVPANCRRVLDVGCGTGGFGASLKQTREIEVWGVEPVSSAAEKASAKLDNVVCGPFDSQINLPVGNFDCVIFNDVLEHMVAPERSLRYAKSLLSPGGSIVASIPNIQYLPIVWRLLFHAQWEYTDAGVLDKTHLRFFTKSTIVTMFQSEGYSLQSICGINAYGCDPMPDRILRNSYKLINELFFGRFGDMK